MTASAFWFAYSPERKGEHPKLHLKDCRGALQANAYAGFNLFPKAGQPTRSPVGPTPGASSTRSTSPTLQPTTTKVIQRIVTLYAIEVEIRGSISDARKAVRQTRAKPLLDSIRF